jgi:hypothetical protein
MIAATASTLNEEAGAFQEVLAQRATTSIQQLASAPMASSKDDTERVCLLL